MLVMISVIDILVSLISNSGTKILGMLRVLRLLRTLRPLRYTDHNIHSVLQLVIRLNNSYNYIKALMHKCITTCHAVGYINTYMYFGSWCQICSIHFLTGNIINVKTEVSQFASSSLRCINQLLIDAVCSCVCVYAYVCVFVCICVCALHFSSCRGNFWRPSLLLNIYDIFKQKIKIKYSSFLPNLPTKCLHWSFTPSHSLLSFQVLLNSGSTSASFLMLPRDLY